MYLNLNHCYKATGSETQPQPVKPEFWGRWTQTAEIPNPTAPTCLHNYPKVPTQIRVFAFTGSSSPIKIAKLYNLASGIAILATMINIINHYLRKCAKLKGQLNWDKAVAFVPWHNWPSSYDCCFVGAT